MGPNFFDLKLPTRLAHLLSFASLSTFEICPIMNGKIGQMVGVSVVSVFVNRVCVSVFVIVRVLRCSVISDVLDLRPHESMANMLQCLKV